MGSKKISVDLDFVRNLAELISETDLSEIEIEEDDTRIRLARGGGETHVSAPVYHPAAAPAAPAPAAAPTASPTAEPATAEQSKPEAGTPLPSPMVGTAYLAPSPDAEPFVEVGKAIKKGETVMIVEAMKTMNQIAATQDCTIVAITVDDGQPVEFGQTLLTFK